MANTKDGSTMTNEYVIWGIPPVDKCTYCETHDNVHDNQEAPLYSLAETLEETNRVMEVLTNDHGITSAHIQVIDFSEDLATMWKNPKLINLG